MRSFTQNMIVLASATLMLWSCKPGDTGGDKAALSLLKTSMDRYARLQTFRAKCMFTMSSPGEADSNETREFEYRQPNQFKVVSTQVLPKAMLTTISDGTSEIEYDNYTGQAPQRYPAPSTIAGDQSMLMQHPMFCGTLLYQFFGGSGNLDNVVDSSKGDIRLGPEEMSSTGEPAQVVKFYGRQNYGNVEVLIGKTSSYVYRIRYDSEPLMKMTLNPEAQKAMKEEVERAIEKEKNPARKAEIQKSLIELGKQSQALVSTEQYTDISTPPSIAQSEFIAEAPKGATPVVVTAEGVPASSPLPIGKPAPDFSVTRLDGSVVKLTSFKGHPVMIDFWATWCGPCVESLPHTQDVFDRGVAKGLQVMAISDEDHATVSKFISDKHYRFPTFTDKASRAEKEYQIEAIPTTVVIDPHGNLVAYIVGGGQDNAISAALAKAGVKL